jgi:SulP family sulfate permease
MFGPLFFGSIELFNSKFDVKEDPHEVVVDFAESRVVDQSAIEALNKLAERYQKNGKTIHLRHLSADCVTLIKRAEKICDVNVLEDPDYFVAIDDYNNLMQNKKV